MEEESKDENDFGQLSKEQFLKGYSTTDAIYDSL